MRGRKHRSLFRLPFNRPEPGEVDDEFAFHLAMRARELERTGLGPDEARARALAEFGDIDDARAFCRAEDEGRMRHDRWTRWLDGLKQDLVLAARTLRRHPGFAASTLVTLTVAITLATAAYGIVHAYLIRPLPYPDADRLVRVHPEATRGQLPDWRHFERIDWRVADSVFAATAAWNPDAMTVAGTDRSETLRGSWVTPAYFTMMGVGTALGRIFEPREHLDNAPVAIISDGLWNRLFNRDPAVIGRAVRIQSNELPDQPAVVTIVGVLPADQWHVDRFNEILRPMPRRPDLPMMARLADGMTRDEAERRLNAFVVPQLEASVAEQVRFEVVGVQDDYTSRLRPTVVALLGGALFLLLIAGANVGGAQAARAAARRAEIQVRLALGASRRRIVAQLLVENLTIALVAATIGAVIAGSALAMLGGTVTEQLGTAVPGGTGRLRLEPGILVLVVAAGALIGTVFGLLPSLAFIRSAASTSRSGSALGSSKGTARTHTSPVLRRGLIVLQVGFTMMLLVGAGLMVRTILAIATTPLGFEERRVVSGNLFLPPSRYRGAVAVRDGMDRLLAGVSGVPGVTAVAGAIPDPLMTYTLSPIPVTGQATRAAEESPVRAAPYLVTAGYFDVLGIPVKAGRAFGPTEAPGSPRSVIVSEKLARDLWPGQTAVGRQLKASDDSTWATVVGVVGEIRQPAEQQPVGELYYPMSQYPRSMFFVQARVAGSPTAVIPGIQRAVSQVDESLSIAGLAPLRDIADRATSRHHALATVLSIFAVLALGLAMLGLYASLAYVVTQRRREIAIRVAVGADLWSVRGLVAREGGAVVAGGLLLGVVLSISLSRVLASQLYGVSPTDLATFVLILPLVGAAALLAALVPLRQATRVDPVEVLRSE